MPATVLAQVAAAAGLAGAIPDLAGYDDTTYRVRLATLVRGHAGVDAYDREARGMAARACIEAARTRDDLADIVNAGVEPRGSPDIEELLRCRRELPAFGALLRLARSARTLYLLGIKLMPRIRSRQGLRLFRPDVDARFEHIDGLFTGAIDWPLIEARLPDMLRVVLSIRAGHLLPSAILRRLATYSRKNRLYFALRELGRVIRTDFLLRYLGSADLRRTIGAATNKNELFSCYAQWLAFGNSGLATAAKRDEQRKMVKYNHLVANLLIFHTVIGMTCALDSLAANGHGAAITPEAVAGTSPYLNEHLNRFGSYELDLSKPPAPLPSDLPAYARPPSAAPTSKAPV